LAFILPVAGAPQAAQAEKLSARPPASHAIILARRECIAWKWVNGKRVCVNWNDCKPGDKVC
jgi:hypothetical protein